MENIYKLIEILEKRETITSSENEFIKSESAKDDSVKAFVENYEKLKSLFHSNTHIDPEILGEYILYKNGEEGSGKYLPVISEKIETHLETCAQCKMEFQQLQEEYLYLNEQLVERINDEGPTRPRQSFTFPRSLTHGYRVAIGTILILLSAYAGMKVTSEISTPDYKKKIIALEEDQNLATRGRTSELFQKSISALSKDKFKDAISYLHEDIEKNKNDKSIFYSYYILGLTHLKNSIHNLLGTFNSFDHGEVNKAIDNLKLSIEKNDSGLYKNLNLDAHYYIGVGYMILDKPDVAKQHLHIVINNHGSFYKEAAEILSSQEKN